MSPSSTSLSTPSSPNSYRLLSRHPHHRNPSPLLLSIRFRPPHRRTLTSTLCSTKGSSSWTTNSSKDSFAGWSGSDNDGDGGKNNDRFGGMLGAGLAGIFFTAGITFASLSLSSRTTSGVKPHMEPLTAEQEVLVTSDDSTAKVHHSENESNAMVQVGESKTLNDCSEEYESGINKDPFTHLEINEDATETSHADNNKPSDNAVDAIRSDSSQDDLQTGPDVDNITIPSGYDPSSPDLSSLGDSQSTNLSGFPESTVNLGTVNHVDSSSLNLDSTIHSTDHQEGNLSQADLPMDLSSEAEARFFSQTLTFNHKIVESGGVVDSQVSDREVVEAAISVSVEQDIEHSDMPQLPADASTSNSEVNDMIESVPSGTIFVSDFDRSELLMLQKESISSAEVHVLDESAPSVSYSVPVSADSNKYEPDISSHSQADRSSIVDSLIAEKSFSHVGIPAPSLVSAALQVSPGKVLVPAVVDQAQGQALAALQVLKVIEADVQPGDLCTRREYARWLVSASSTLPRNTISKVYPAMYIENVTELAFDDVTPEDPDFSFIQGLAEAGIISSKLSRSDLNAASSGQQDSFLFSPESPVSRQDLVSWKMALEKRQLPEVDRNYLYQCSGYIDTDRIDPDAWPAIVADLSSGEQGVTALAFGYTRLFQPNKPVTKAQAAIALATGDAAEVVGEELTRIEAESLAETAVNAHTALVAQVEKDLNASFERELAMEKEKIDAVEKLAEEARMELERLRAEREEENNALIRGRAAVESEMEVLSRLRHEMEEQLQDLMSNKIEISFERDRINNLRKEAESENKAIVQLQYELDVERKALSMARVWAEEEAKKAREQAKALEEAREWWERRGLKIVVDEELQNDASTGITWASAGKQPPVDETIGRAENLVEKLKAMAAEIKVKSSNVIEKIIQKLVALISALKHYASEVPEHVVKFQSSIVSKANISIEELKENASELSSGVGDKARRAAEDCKETVQKFTQKFKA